MTLIERHPLRPSPNARASTSNDGLVLLDVDAGLVLSANVVGARIWQLIEHHRTPSEIAEQLVIDYGVPHARAQADVTTFIAALIERDLVAQDVRS